MFKDACPVHGPLLAHLPVGSGITGTMYVTFTPTAFPKIFLTYGFRLNSAVGRRIRRHLPGLGPRRRAESTCVLSPATPARSDHPGACGGTFSDQRLYARTFALSAPFGRRTPGWTGIKLGIDSWMSGERVGPLGARHPARRARVGHHRHRPHSHPRWALVVRVRGDPAEPGQAARRPHRPAGRTDFDLRRGRPHHPISGEDYDAVPTEAAIAGRQWLAVRVCGMADRDPWWHIHRRDCWQPRRG